MASAKSRKIKSPWKRDERVIGDDDHIELDLGDGPTLRTDFQPLSRDVEALKMGAEPPEYGPMVMGREIHPRHFPQASFVPAFTAKERYLVLHGGAGAGKSIAAAQKVIMKSLKYPNSMTVVMRAWSPRLRVTAFRMLKEILNENMIPYHVNNTTMKIDFPNGSTIHGMAIVDSQGGEIAASIKSLTDISGMWIEEPTELSLEEFEMIRMRLRGRELPEGQSRQLILTFNPIDRNHWLHEMFFNEMDDPMEDEDTRIFHYTFEDNEFIDAAYKKMLLGIKDQNRYNVYTLGKWGELGAMVYDRWKQWDFNSQEMNFDTIIGGADFGFSHPSAFCVLGIDESKHEIYVIDEVYQHAALNRDFIDSIKSKLKQNGIETTIPIYCDASEPASIQEMRQHGLNTIAGQKNILDGISSVRQYCVRVHPRCDSFLSEISGYTRQKDQQGRVLEMPNKKAGFDDLMDAMRYAVYTYSLSQKLYTTVIPSIRRGRGRYDFIEMAGE
jgi:phage terminase large subunit